MAAGIEATIALHGRELLGCAAGAAGCWGAVGGSQAGREVDAGTG